MEIRLKSTGRVVTEGEFRALFPNTSLPQVLSEGLINELGGDVVFEGPYPQSTRYQIVFRDGIYPNNGKWFTKYSVKDMDAEGVKAVNTAQETAIRNQRNDKLQESDWTQVADAPVDKTAWAVYRTALRNITEQGGFPWDVKWPTEPTKE